MAKNKGFLYKTVYKNVVLEALTYSVSYETF